MIQDIALVAAVALPFWNIPLIVRIIRRKSSEDISLHWAVGVWVCILLMAPSGFTSKDPVWRAFNIVNLIFFTLTLATIFFYRKKR